MPDSASNVLAFTARPVQAPAGAAPAHHAPIRVLIVDDSPEDRMIARMALESQDYLLSEADSGEGGIAAATAIRPDCILLDNRLPDLDGHEVLDGLRRADGSMPCAVVMLTGSTNGATATKLLKAGAIDYLSKDSLSEDGVRRAVLGAIERHRLIEQNRTANERNAQLAAIIAASSDAIVSCDLDDRIRTWNAGAVALFGYSVEEAIGRTIEELIVPVHLVEQRRKLYEDVKSGSVSIVLESERRCKDGSIVPIEVNASPMFNDGGSIVGISVIFRDISERKRAEVQRAADLDAMTRLHRLGTIHVEGVDLAPVLAEIIETAKAISGADFGNIQLIDPASGDLRIAAQVGFEPDWLEYWDRVSKGQGCCGTALERGARIMVEDVSSSPIFQGSPALEVQLRAGVRAVQSTPLVSRMGKAVGIISTHHRQPHRWNDHAQRLLDLLAGQAADMIESRLADQALRQSEQRLAATYWHAPIGIVETTLDGRYVNVNGQFCRITGYDAEELRSRAIRDITHPEDWPRNHDHFMRLVGGEISSFTIEKRYIRKDGSLVWCEITRSVLRNAKEEPLFVIGIAIDITARKQAEHALRAAHDTFRNLVDRSPFGVYAVDADFRLVQVSLGARKVFENVRPLLDRDFAEVLRVIWPEPFATELIGRFRHTLATGEPYHSPSTVERRADIGDTEAYDWKIERVTLPDGRPGVVCHFYDLSERQRHEERVELLMKEINHRAKNMLGLVQAIARQTAAANPAEFIRRFEERVRAIATNQDLLIKSEWKKIPLSDLVRSHIQHLAEARFAIEGPPIETSAKAAQALGMALHELTTNAVKYGALSNDTGSVAVRWRIEPDADGKLRLAMEWRESGGPAVATPSRRGFGSTVIEAMVRMNLHCKASVDYAPNGLVWSIDCPIDAIMEEGAAPPASPISSTMPRPSSGRKRPRVLVVEDEALLAMEIAQSILGADWEVVGPASNPTHALEMIATTGCDAAVLDTNLGDETSEPVAAELTRLRKPFIVVSGLSRQQQPPLLRDAPMIGKPLDHLRLISEMSRWFERS